MKHTNIKLLSYLYMTIIEYIIIMMKLLVNKKKKKFTNQIMLNGMFAAIIVEYIWFF